MLKLNDRGSLYIFRVFLPVFVLCLIVVVRGQSDPGKIVASRDFTLPRESEVALEIDARSPGASWGKTGAEAAALRIEIDGQYCQDLLLWAGDAPFTYRLMLGRLASGKHQVTASSNKTRSAAGAQQTKVRSLRTVPLVRDSHHTSDDLLALQYSPVLYQRANTIDRFSDLPVLMYYEVSHEPEGEVKVRYTMIFTNEDGGTQTAALMSRWGRAADIEWVYEFRARDGQIVKETFQGVEHETKPFRGERLNGNHPLLAVASDNNNFSDHSSSSVRFALMPIAADLREASRESVIDANPWINRLVAEELMREGKIRAEPTDRNIISDPRNYLYVDMRAIQNETAISVEARSIEQLNSSSSDLGDSKLRIDRSGYFRTAVRLSSPQSGESVSTLIVRCHSMTGHDCKEVKIKSVSMLNNDYSPRLLPIENIPPQDLKANQSLTITLRPKNHLHSRK